MLPPVLPTITPAARTILDDATTGAMLQTLGRGRKNAIINGDMLVAQRGTSFAAIANGAYCLDRWGFGYSGTVVSTITQNSDVPSVANAGRVIPSSLRVQITTADSSIGSTDYCCVYQLIEGTVFGNFAQRDLTLSFWVRSGKTGTHTVTLKSGGQDRSYVTEYTINNNDTWEFKTVSIPASPSGGTWNNVSTGIGAFLVFTFSGGSTFQTTAGSWQTGNYFSTSNQVNVTDSNSSRYFAITGVQLEVGSGFSGFEFRSFEEELRACQRYYEASRDHGLANTTGSTNGLLDFKCNGTAHYQVINFKVSKRTTPTVTTWNISTGTSGTWRDNTASTNKTATAADIGQNGCVVAIASTVDLNNVYGHWEADAEL